MIKSNSSEPEEDFQAQIVNFPVKGPQFRNKNQF